MFGRCFKSALIIASLALAFVSCAGLYNINGIVETSGFEGRELSLIEFLPSGTTKYDSCVVNHGRFQMKGCVDSTRMVFLCREGQPLTPVYLERGNITISLLPTKMQVSGTRQNDLFYTFLHQKVACDNRYEDMIQHRLSLSRTGMDAERMEVIQDSLRIIVDECEDMIFSFMKQNYNEPAAVGVFMMLSAGPSNEVSPLIRRILDAAPDKFLRESYVNGYIRRVGYARVDGIDQ